MLKKFFAICLSSAILIVSICGCTNSSASVTTTSVARALHQVKAAMLQRPQKMIQIHAQRPHFQAAVYPLGKRMR